jgi:hypothetical protein
MKILRKLAGPKGLEQRVLVAGWFSYPDGHATAGDLLIQQLVCEWLGQVGIQYDVALAAPFADGVNWQRVDPRCYSHVMFLCGPFEKGPLEQAFLKRFERCIKVGINLSMFEPLDDWNPFDHLWERDSSRTARPDLSILATQSLVPVVVRVLVEPQPEYGERALHEVANASIQRLIESQQLALVDVDTRLDKGNNKLRTPAEIESLIANADVVVTTRLHGMVLALKNGVPAVAVDPIQGGAKILRQAKVLGWPSVITADSLSDAKLAEAFSYCLSPAARRNAHVCAERARSLAGNVREELLETMRGAPRLA